MKNIVASMLALWIIRSHSFASAASSRDSYQKDDTQRRSLQDNKNDKKPADTNKAPPPPPALTVNETRSSNSSSLGFSIESNNAQSTLSAVCSTTYSTSSTSQTAPLSQQTFEFQYYMYTNASKSRKIAELDRRYLTPLARSVLECSPDKNDYDFVVQGIVAQVHNGTDAATDCASLADGTKCILAVGSFEALIKKAIDSSDNSNGRHLTDQDLSDPDLIIAFGGVLGTLFAGTELLDDEIKSLAFDGFINGFSPGRSSSSGMESYPGIDGGGGIDTTNSTVEATKSNNLLLPIVASAVALAVAVTLIVLVVVQRRKRRTAAEGFHNLDCGSSWGEYDEPTKPSDASCSVPPEQSLGNSQTNLKQLEDSIEPEFDFDVNTVNHVLGFAGREDELPSDEEQERSSHLELPPYLNMQRRNSPPPMYDAYDLYSTRSDLTPNTVDL